MLWKQGEEEALEVGVAHCNCAASCAFSSLKAATCSSVCCNFFASCSFSAARSAAFSSIASVFARSVASAAAASPAPACTAATSAESVFTCDSAAARAARSSSSCAAALPSPAFAAATSALRSLTCASAASRRACSSASCLRTASNSDNLSSATCSASTNRFSSCPRTHAHVRIHTPQAVAHQQEIIRQDQYPEIEELVCQEYARASRSWKTRISRDLECTRLLHWCTPHYSPVL